MIIQQWHSPAEYYYEGGMGTQRVDLVLIGLRNSEGRRKRPGRKLTFIENLLLWIQNLFTYFICLIRTAWHYLKLRAVVPESDGLVSHPGVWDLGQRLHRT